MTSRSPAPRLGDMIQACERIRHLLQDLPLDVFETDWQKQWIVERGIEIISEASRHLADELKVRHPNIPDLPDLEQACRQELAITLAKKDTAGEKMP
jgi:uncharacterized protein with HEPN domain